MTAALRSGKSRVNCVTGAWRIPPSPSKALPSAGAGIETSQPRHTTQAHSRHVTRLPRRAVCARLACDWRSALADFQREIDMRPLIERRTMMLVSLEWLDQFAAR
jgi:hypothetical protein